MLDWNEYSTLHQTPENIRGKKRVISLMVYLPCHCFRLTKICWILFRFVLLFYAIQHKECLEWFILFCSYFSVYEFNVTRIYMDRGKQSERDSWLFWWRMKSTRIPIAEKENGWSFFFFKSDTIMNEPNYLFCQHSSTLEVWMCCIDACECESVFRWFIIYIIFLWRTVYYLVKEFVRVR